MSDKTKKLTDDPLTPMTEALGQSTDEETATKYTTSLSAEQQLVNSTAQVDDDSLYRNSQPYVPGSQAMIDAIVAAASKIVPTCSIFIAKTRYSCMIPLAITSSIQRLLFQKSRRVNGWRLTPGSIQ